MKYPKYGIYINWNRAQIKNIIDIFNDNCYIARPSTNAANGYPHSALNLCARQIRIRTG